MTHDPGDEPKLDLDAWDAQLPPSDFAERVLARVSAKDGDRGAKASGVAAGTEPAPAPMPSMGRRRGTWTAVAAAVTAVAAALVLRMGHASNAPEARGEAIARDRTEVSVGSRARAVLEPGAQVSWSDDDVVQAHGDVFYRVEPGARFRVHTPAGDVEVKGTCFTVKVRGEARGSTEVTDMNKRDVKSGVVGAAIAGLAFVAVYEGKVTVSRAGERVDLGAGESAQASASGVTRTGSNGDGEKAFGAMVAAGEEPLAMANESLVSQVGEYRRRLEAISAQKVELETTLKNTEQKLASKTADASHVPSRAEFDLGADEWKELAKDGTIKFMMPCTRSREWTTSPEQLQKLALAPGDGPALQYAYARSNERLWTVIKPLCAQALGSLEVAEKVGRDTCVHLVFDQAKQKEEDGANEAMRQVGEIRAGLRAAPAASQATSPVLKMFLALTGEMKAFETDLAQSLGPEEAHRVAFADGMCMGRSTYGGGGPREPEPKK